MTHFGGGSRGGGTLFGEQRKTVIRIYRAVQILIAVWTAAITYEREKQAIFFKKIKNA